MNKCLHKISLNNDSFESKEKHPSGKEPDHAVVSTLSPKKFLSEIYKFTFMNTQPGMLCWCAISGLHYSPVLQCGMVERHRLKNLMDLAVPSPYYFLAMWPWTNALFLQSLRFLLLKWLIITLLLVGPQWELNYSVFVKYIIQCLTEVNVQKIVTIVAKHTEPNK